MNEVKPCKYQPLHFLSLYAMRRNEKKKKTNEERNNIESSFFFVQKTGGPHLAPRVAGLSLLIWGLEKNSTNCCMKEDIGAACGFRAALLTSHEMLGSWSADLVTRHHHLSSLCVH